MDQEQFAHYLGQGLGRPHLWLRAHDSTPYADALLHACLVDELHSLGFGLNDIFTQHPTSAAADIFLDLYERGPCSLCRERFVQRLIDIGSLPEWLKDEGLYDANVGIRKAISTYSQPHPN